MRKLVLVSREVDFGRFFDRGGDLKTKKTKIILLRSLRWTERLASSCNRHHSSATTIANKIRKTNAMIEKVRTSERGEAYFKSDCYRARGSLISSLKTSLSFIVRSICQLPARCSFEVQAKEQERRELSVHCRSLSKLDELHTQHRCSMDRWIQLRCTPTDVHFMRPWQRQIEER